MAYPPDGRLRHHEKEENAIRERRTQESFGRETIPRKESEPTRDSHSLIGKRGLGCRLVEKNVESTSEEGNSPKTEEREVEVVLGERNDGRAPLSSRDYPQPLKEVEG